MDIYDQNLDNMILSCDKDTQNVSKLRLNPEYVYDRASCLNFIILKLIDFKMSGQPT